MSQLILVRHGESLWNHTNLFTGWADIGLTQRGILQMQELGTLLKARGLLPEGSFTSRLLRCRLSHNILLGALGRPELATTVDWRLNERHYGALTGLSKEQAVTRFGKEQVHRWRRSFDAVPPLLDAAANRDLVAAACDELPAASAPRGESLAQVVERVASCWAERLLPALQGPHRILVTAHGNSLRALIKLIEGISDEAIASLEVANAGAVVYDMQADGRLQASARLLPSVLTPSAIL